MATYFTFTPNTRDLSHFETDIRTFIPLLLRDSIVECVEAQRDLAETPPALQRKRIHDVYTRKIKEFSAAYPILFSLENALRSTLAHHLAEVFGRMDWWAIIHDARLEGKSTEDFKVASGKSFGEETGNIRGVAVPMPFLNLVWCIFSEMKNKIHIESVKQKEIKKIIDGVEVVLRPERTDEFYYCLTLGDLWLLIKNGWIVTQGTFCSDQDFGFILTKKVFNDAMRVIKDARNELFYSNPVKNPTSVITCCENILNCLNFHVGDFDRELGEIQYVRTHPSVARAARHTIPAQIYEGTTRKEPAQGIAKSPA